MRRLIWLPLAALVLAALPAFAQGILPTSVLGMDVASARMAKPGAHDNAQSSAFREYGYVSGEIQSYVQEVTESKSPFISSRIRAAHMAHIPSFANPTWLKRI